MSLLLATALALAPQNLTTAPGGSLERAPVRVAPPQGSYPSYTNGGRTTQLGLLHGEGLETFGLFRPGPLPTNQPNLATERPLLVLFHSFAGDGDIELEAWTEFSDEADARYWYILAPDQDVPLLGFSPTGSTLRRKTYGSDHAQERLALTLRWVLNHYPIDRTRIYAVGFSMGGGDAVSYAAQHLNPEQGAFAAVATNAGTLCLTEEYSQNPLSRDALERAIGGGSAPSASNIFDFEQFSSLLYQYPLFGGSTLDLGRRHPVENLASTPLQAWIDTREPSAHLTRFTDDLEVLFGAPQPGGLFQRHDVTGAPSDHPHRWATFDYGAVCDTFASQYLVVPKAARLTVSRDARYWDLGVKRANPNAFGEVSYDFTGVGVSGNPIDRVFIADCHNIERVCFDGGALLLGMANYYEVELQRNQSAPMRLELQHVQQPSLVLHHGAPTAPAPGVWTYDGGTQTLVLHSTGAATDVWTIL